MPLDEKDLEQIKALLGEAIKASQAETVKLVDSTVKKAVGALDLDKKIEGLKTETDKKLEGLKVEPKPEPKPGETDKIEDSPAFKKLQLEVETAKRLADEQRKRAEEAEAKRRAELLTNSTRDALIAAGADPKRIPFALAALRERGAIKLDDSGQPVFVMKRDWGGTEDVPVDAAAKEWLETDEGKWFVPPTGGSGTGDKAGNPARNGAPVGNPEQIALAALRSLL